MVWKAVAGRKGHSGVCDFGLVLFVLSSDADQAADPDQRNGAAECVEKGECYFANGFAEDLGAEQNLFKVGADCVGVASISGHSYNDLAVHHCGEERSGFDFECPEREV